MVPLKFKSTLLFNILVRALMEIFEKFILSAKGL